jgi:glycerophosphoryl diester phosphodiesterase
MHDHTIDRTTSGTGLIKEKTCAEIKAIAPEVPTLEEFLEGMKDYPDMTYNFELKDYPADDEEWAWESMRKTIELVKKYGLEDKCVINSFSGALLEKVDEEYNHRFKLHGFYPYSILGEVKGNPMDYLFCACLWGKPAYGVDEWYKTLSEKGVEPWVGASVKTAEDLRQAAMMGAKLVTTDDPITTLRILRALGAHE